MLALIFTDGALAKATLLLHFAEERTDWQAAGMPTQAIDWKYAIGAEPTDTGIDASVLSMLRIRPVGRARHGTCRFRSAGGLRRDKGWARRSSATRAQPLSVKGRRRQKAPVPLGLPRPVGAMGPGRGVDRPAPVPAVGSALIRPTPSGQRPPHGSLRTCPGCRRRPRPHCGVRGSPACAEEARFSAPPRHTEPVGRVGRPGAVRSVSPCPSGGRSVPSPAAQETSAGSSDRCRTS